MKIRFGILNNKHNTLSKCVDLWLQKEKKSEESQGGLEQEEKFEEIKQKR